MAITIEGSGMEKRSFGTIDSAVEFLNHRVHENWTVYFGNESDATVMEYRAKIYKVTGMMFTPTKESPSEIDRIIEEVRRRAKFIL